MHTVTLGGRVSLEDGTPLEGAVVTIVWPEVEQELALVTDSAGRYRHEYAAMFEDYRVTVTPSQPDHVFLPPHYNLPYVGGDFLVLDFTAMPSSPDTVSVLVHRRQASLPNDDEMQQRVRGLRG